MLKSMTGFGAGRARAGDEETSVEVRAVNHKHLDLKVRLPRELASLEPVVLQAVRARCSRGTVEVAVVSPASAPCPDHCQPTPQGGDVAQPEPSCTSAAGVSPKPGEQSSEHPNPNAAPASRKPLFRSHLGFLV